MKVLRILLIVLCLLPIGLMAQSYTLVIHGGAGNLNPDKMSESQRKAYESKLSEALKAGEEVLKSGGNALDAVVASVKILEDSPLFNAGKGAVFNADGRNELDASIMCGKTLNAGAVAGVTTLKNPITAARAVMEKSPHVMMIGRGAESFAYEQGIEIVAPDYFYDRERFEQYQQYLRQNHNPDDKKGTVGAVALDIHGNLAAATSTGGMVGKKYGRVGDSPIIGAGTYASNKSCAVSATGHGEYFIRLVVAYRIAALMEFGGMSLEKAAAKVINEELSAMGGTGGIIAVDKEGNIAMPFNTRGMFRASVNHKGETKVLIFEESRP